MTQKQIIDSELARVDVNSLDWWIHFAVDNNIKSVTQNYAAAGYTDEAVNPEYLKNRISAIAKSNPALAARIINVPIVKATNNWTSEVVFNTIAGSNSNPTNNNAVGSKIDWGTIGGIALALGTGVAAYFGIKNPTGTGSGSDTGNNEDLILGLQKNVFYLTIGITLVILALVFYLASKK